MVPRGKVDPPPPTEDEIAGAVLDFRESEQANREAYQRMMLARERLVEILHRTGIREF